MTPKGQVFGFVDDTHAAAAEALVNEVVPDRTPDQRDSGSESLERLNATPIGPGVQ
jgi:hypothetical protein